MSNRIALVEGSKSGATRSALNAAINRGVTPVIITSNPDQYSYDVDGLEFLRADTSESKAIVEAARRLPNLCGLGSTYEYFVGTAAYAAREMGFPGPDPQAIQRCRSKIETRRQLSVAAPALNPGYWHFPASQTDSGFEQDPTERYVLKIPNLSSGSGIVVLQPGANLKAAATALADFRATDNSRLLLEEYLDGPEYSIEMFHGSVLAVTEKVVGGKDGLTEIGHNMQAPLPFEHRVSIENAAVAAVSAVGLDWGPAHVEVKWTLAGPKIVEINARMGGGMISELVHLSTGIDYARAHIDAILGYRVDLSASMNRQCCVRFKMIDRTGTIQRVVGTEDALACEGIHSVGAFFKPGEHRTFHGNNLDRAAWVVAVDSDLERAVSFAERAVQHIQIIHDQ